MDPGAAGVVDIPFPLGALRGLVSGLGQGVGTNMSVALVSLAAIALLGWGLTRLVRSPWGRLVKAVGDDEAAAEGVGAPVVSLKLQVLALGSVLAAVAGGLLALQNLSINPQFFKPVPTFYAWVILILGGLGSLRGALAGSALFWVVFVAPRWVPFAELGVGVDSQQVAAIQLFLVGLMLMVLVVARPHGLFGDKEEMEVME